MIANLASPDFASAPIRVGSATVLSLAIAPSSTYSGTGWTVELQYALTIERDSRGVDLTNWRSFSPTLTFTNTTRSRTNIAVPGVGWVRLRTITAAGAGDPAALVTLQLQ